MDEIEQKIERLDNRLYKKLLKASKEVFGSYSIIVPNLQMLSDILGIKYDWFFRNALERFAKSQKGEIHITGDREYWIEVLPF